LKKLIIIVLLGTILFTPFVQLRAEKKAEIDKNPIVQELIEQLGSSTYEVREDASKALYELGQSMIPQLKDAVLEKNMEISYRALQILKELCHSKDKGISKAAYDAIIIIANSNPFFYNDTFKILRRPSELWVLNVGAILKSPVKNGKHKTKLVLNGNQVNDVGLKHLQYLPELTHLELNSTNTSDKGLVHLKKLKNITSFSLNNNKANDSSIEKIIVFDKLEELNLNNCPITDKSLQVIANFKNLKKLSLNNTLITDAGIAFLLPLKLEALSLENTNITDNCLETIQQFNTLKNISFVNTKIKGLALSRNILKAFEKNTLSIDEYKVKLLNAIYQLGHVVTNEIILESLRKTSESQSNNNQHINDLMRQLAFIWLYSVNSSLKKGKNYSVTLSGKDVTDKGLEHLKILSEITHLIIKEDVAITDKGIQTISHLKNLKNLTINSPNITDEGLQHINKLTKLVDINLSGTQFSDKGLKKLKILKNLKKSFSLNLSNTKIIGEGFKDFNFTQSPYFTLNLSNTEVTDKSVFQLKDKIKRGRLFLRQTKVTEEGVKKLNKAFKENGFRHVTVIWDQ